MIETHRLRWIEWAVALLTVAAIVFLHLVNLRHAGGLWRDEVITYRVATMPSLAELWSSIWYDSFPAGIHLVLRLWSGLGGGASDLGLRLFGALIGLGVLAVVWLNARLLGSRVPLLSMMLIGFSPVVIRYGDSIRAYGLGSVTILLTFGLIWAVTATPAPRRILFATAAAILSVQTLYQNTVLLTAICLGGVVVTLWRGERKRSVLVIAIWLAAMLALVPYRGILSKASEGQLLMPYDVGFARLFKVLFQALGSPVDFILWVWIGLFILGIGLAVSIAAFRSGGPAADSRRDVVVFCATAMVTGTLGFMAFMRIVGVPSQPWNYTPLAAFVAVALEGIFSVLTTAALGRLATVVLALSMMGSIVLPAWRGVQIRQTNIDLIASRLRVSAGPDDMILVYPWYCGATFQRYFNGQTFWSTLPPQVDPGLQDKGVFKQHMMSVEPNRSVMDRLVRTLESGNRVWLVGGLPFRPTGEPPPAAPPAPNAPWGWNHDAYSTVWGMHAGHLIQTRALRRMILPPVFEGAVNPYEMLHVVVAEGSRRG
jgi:hypothetical protein